MSEVEFLDPKEADKFKQTKMYDIFGGHPLVLKLCCGNQGLIEKHSEHAYLYPDYGTLLPGRENVKKCSQCLQRFKLVENSSE